MRRPPDPGDNIIDSRYIIDWLNTLRADRAALEEAVVEAGEDLDNRREDAADYKPEGWEAALDDAESALKEAESALSEWDADYTDELTMLERVNREGEDCGDWMHGEAMIHENYWVEYVQGLVSDIGDLPGEVPGYIVIDWEATAENIRADYTTIDFGGETYYVRS